MLPRDQVLKIADGVAQVVVAVGQIQPRAKQRHAQIVVHEPLGGEGKKQRENERKRKGKKEKQQAQERKRDKRR
jgi:hypothetical protein